MIRFAKRTTGWIGIDVGTSSVKVAQVTREQNRWKLASSAIIPRSLVWNTAEQSVKVPTSAGEIATAASLQTELKGRAAAAALPMALCQTHQCDGELSVKAARNGALQKLVESATCQPASHLQCAAWPAERGKNGTPVKTNIIAAPQALTDQLCDDVQQSGWSCQAIDGLPLALARAVAMTSPAVQQSTWAAIDFGYSQSTFCVVQHRMPVYVRTLKGCGLGQLLDTLCVDLKIDQPESLQLFQEHDLSSPVSDDVGSLVRHAFENALSKLTYELQRTFSHLHSQRRTIIPEGIFLFGGGASLNGLDGWLTEQTEIEYRRWRCDDFATASEHDGESVSHLLGPAIALSALAWEKR